MAQKTRREKEIARLRREIEILRAQASGRSPTPAGKTHLTYQNKTEERPPLPRDKILLPKTPDRPRFQRVDQKFIRADLIKTAALSALSLGIIAVLYLFRNLLPFFR